MQDFCLLIGFKKKLSLAACDVFFKLALRVLHNLAVRLTFPARLNRRSVPQATHLPLILMVYHLQEMERLPATC